MKERINTFDFTLDVRFCVRYNMDDIRYIENKFYAHENIRL